MKNQHELKRRRRNASSAQLEETARRAARNAGTKARVKARQYVRFLDEILLPIRRSIKNKVRA